LIPKEEKKIISICDISPTRLSSFEKFLAGITRSLKDENIHHIIIFREKPSQIVESVLLECGAEIDIMKPSRWNLLNSLKVLKKVKHYKPTIIHFHFYPIHTIINYVAFLEPLKIIYTGHMGGKKPKNALHNLIRKMYYYSSSVLFDIGIEKIVCVSEYVRDNYFTSYNIKTKKSVVIYNGIDTEHLNKEYDAKKVREQYNLSEQDSIITCVSLRKDKGAHHLIKAAPQIIEMIENVKFVLVGAGECEQYFKEMVNKRKLEKYFIFTGIVPDIYPIYNISECVVMPSIFEEACPFTAIEAMSMGVPVVAYDSGGTKEVVSDGVTGYIIKREIKLLVEKIIELHEGNNYISMKNNSKRLFHERFLLDTCVDNYISLYKSTISKDKN
jgi:glycosyltransferase involved in cell wall biosynthesis